MSSRQRPASEDALAPSDAAFDDSTYELVSNAGIMSDDEATTASLASHSVAGDTADDFSSIEASDASEDEEEDEQDMDPMTASEVEGAYASEDEETPALLNAVTFRQPQIDDSNLTARPEDELRRRAVSPTREDDDEVVMEGRNAMQHLLPHTSIIRAQGVARPSQDANRPHNMNLHTLVKDSLRRLREQPFIQRLAALPWPLISVCLLGVAQVALGYAALSWFAAKPPTQPAHVPLNDKALSSIFGNQAVQKPTKSTRRGLSWVHRALYEPVPSANISMDPQPQPTKAAKKPSSPPAKREDGLKSLSSVTYKTFGPDVDYKYRKPGSFNIVQQSNTDYIIVAPAAIVFRDPQVTVSVCRRGMPVKFQLTKLRRGVHHLHFAEEDAFWMVNVTVRSKGSSGKEQVEPIHFSNTWRAVSNDLSSQVNSQAQAIGGAAADAASKIVNALTTDLLIPAELATKNLAVFVKNGLLFKPSNATKSQQIAFSNKSLVPQFSWADAIKAQHEFVKAQKELASKVAAKANCMFCQISNVVSGVSTKAASEVSKQLRKVNLSAPIGSGKQVLKNAQLNAKGLVGKTHRDAKALKKTVETKMHKKMHKAQHKIHKVQKKLEKKAAKAMKGAGSAKVKKTHKYPWISR